MYTRSSILAMFFVLTGCSFDLSHLRGTPLVFQDTHNDGGTPLFQDAGMGGSEDAYISNLEDSPTIDHDSAMPVDSSISGDDASNGLDPDLSTPPRGNQVCVSPSFVTPIRDVCDPNPTYGCRLISQTELRCEPSNPTATTGTPCTDGTGCEERQACFRGACAHICNIGSSVCEAIGAGECISVGHPRWGVCQTTT